MTALEEREGPLRFDPHALLTPLDWCAYGGASPLVMPALLKVKRVHVSPGDEIVSLRSDIASKDQKIGQLEEALEEMSLSENKIDMSRNYKKALEFVNKESFVHDGRFVVPVPLSRLKKVDESSKKSYGRRRST